MREGRGGWEEITDRRGGVGRDGGGLGVVASI